jgi:glycosyltransferase involved in cell wall biosynthesis
MKTNQSKETVAIGLHVWNGEKSIADTLTSLIDQKYKKIKIFILDNQSNDKTVKIVQKFKKKFKKIRLIVDKEKRDPASAQRILLYKYLKNYKYCMLIGDDDIVDKDFIKKNICKLIAEKSQLSYSPYKLIYYKKKIFYIKDYPVYINGNVNKSFLFNSYFLNLIKFIIYRNLVPIMFGVFETKALKKSFKYYKIYDKSAVNFDNLMLADFLANNKISYIKNTLFYYRKKNRKETAVIRKQKGVYQFQTLSIYLFLIFKYQFTFSKKILYIIHKSTKIELIHKLILDALLIIVYFQKCFSFIFRKIFFIKFQYD